MTDRIVVVGGGLVGTATAYFAAREGLSVTLLEQEAVGYGASGRNPGFVWLHCRNPGWALEVSMAGRRLYDDLVRDLPVPFEFRAEGGLIYFTTPEQGRVFEEFVARRRDDGLDMELIDGAEVRRQVGPIRPDVLGASFCANDAQINTPTVVAALAAGARAEGADVREGVTVTALARARRPRRRRRDGRRTGRGRHGRHRHRCVDPASCWPHRTSRCRWAWSASRCSPPCPARSTSTRWSTGRWRPSSTACSGTCRRGTSADVPRALRDRVRAVDAPAAVAAGQRRGPARLPDGLPARGHARGHAVGPAGHGDGDQRGLPGPARRRHRPDVGGRAAVHLGPGADHRRGRDPACSSPPATCSATPPGR